MTAEEVLYDLLSKDQAVVALVGTRITQERPLVDATFPLVFFTLENRDPVYTLNHGAGTVPEMWGLECWTKTSAQRKALVDAVRTRLDLATEANTGLLGLRGILLQPGEGPIEAESVPLYGWQQTFRVIVGDP